MIIDRKIKREDYDVQPSIVLSNSSANTDNTVGTRNDTISNNNNDGNDINNTIIPQTVINGRGLWKSWTRNFNKPLLALLDLLDNAFDATLSSSEQNNNNKGRVQITPDYLDDNTSTDSNDNITTGIVIINSSLKIIKPLDKILEVYTSSKGSGSDSIGENGVGLKQGCATLSNLSFCLSCNKLDNNEEGPSQQRIQFSLGIIAYKLQTDTKCSLPSFTFQSNNIEQLKDEMINLFTNDTQIMHPSIIECITDYGGNDSILDGIERIVKHYVQMTTTKKWEKYKHKFGLIVHKLRHCGEDNINSDIDNNTIQNDNEKNNDMMVQCLLNELKLDLPKRYLHIPSKVNVTVDNDKINFTYWQPRLVELMTFNLHINKNIPVTEDNYWKCTPDAVPESYKKNIYTIKLYIGFDSQRLLDQSIPNNPYLYYHSRDSGRLIKCNKDARAELHLTTGSTNYCQALTIIVDDVYGGLPLNPTKQDVAFSEHSNGEIHHDNLCQWISAAARAYWNYYNFILGSKSAISNVVKQMINDVNKEIRQKQQEPLKLCIFNKFTNEFVKSTQNSQTKIRLVPTKELVIKCGVDTRLQIDKIIHGGPSSSDNNTRQSSSSLHLKNKRVRKNNNNSKNRNSIKTKKRKRIEEEQQIANHAYKSMHSSQHRQAVSNDNDNYQDNDHNEFEWEELEGEITNQQHISQEKEVIGRSVASPHFADATHDDDKNNITGGTYPTIPRKRPQCSFPDSNKRERGKLSNNMAADRAAASASSPRPVESNMNSSTSPAMPKNIQQHSSSDSNDSNKNITSNTIIQQLKDEINEKDMLIESLKEKNVQKATENRQKDKLLESRDKEIKMLKERYIQKSTEYDIQTIQYEKLKQDLTLLQKQLQNTIDKNDNKQQENKKRDLHLKLSLKPPEE